LPWGWQTMKIFTIGDSLSQGFMSAAAARTDMSFSTLIAEQLGLVPGTDYQVAHWPYGGLPVNIERVLRRLNKVYGSDISGVEWLFALHTINSVMDKAEDYYEDGEGSEDSRYRAPSKFSVREPAFFHNVAVWGFDIADSWSLTPALCYEMIEQAEDVWIEDGFLTGPNASMYRTALQVLNPARMPEFNDFSQLRWLRHHTETEGIENLILWLGPNNVLGTVVRLNLNQTPGTADPRPADLTHLERAAHDWNIWHPNDYAYEFERLLEQVVDAMANNNSTAWRAFVPNVPHVTIPPIIKGLGPTFQRNGRTYFNRYTYFPFGNNFASRTRQFLSGSDAVFIDETIDTYNIESQRIIADVNKTLNNGDADNGPFYIVDLNTVLSEIAHKRNNGNPTYQFPEFFDGLQPPLTTHYYNVNRDGDFIHGGLFSLDGVHPSIIGQGIIAYEIMKVMKRAGVAVNPDGLDWEKIYKRDSLLQRPIALMDELYEHERLATIAVKAAGLVGMSAPTRFDL